MMVDGIPPSLRGSVDFCSFGRYSHKRPRCQACGNFVGTSLAFRFSEIGPRMRLGPHGQGDGLCGLVWGCHTHKED
jgi:hypothetical protein